MTVHDAIDHALAQAQEGSAVVIVARGRDIPGVLRQAADHDPLYIQGTVGRERIGFDTGGAVRFASTDASMRGLAADLVVVIGAVPSSIGRSIKVMRAAGSRIIEATA